MSSSLRYRLCGWAALFLVTVVVGEVYLHRSAPYNVARQFIRHNAVVREEMGPVRTASGWEGTVHYSGTNGWASFRMNVRGTRGSGVVDITLRCHSGKWVVAGARLYTNSGPGLALTQQAPPASRGSSPPG